jgi:hypothetical protein
MSDPPSVLELDEARAFAAARAVAGVALVYVSLPGSAEPGAGSFLEAIARRYGGRITCGCLDRSKAPEFAWTYGLTLTPTLLLLRGGRVLHRLVGVFCLDPLGPALRCVIERELAAA